MLRRGKLMVWYVVKWNIALGERDASLRRGAGIDLAEAPAPGRSDVALRSISLRGELGAIAFMIGFLRVPS